MRRLNMLVLLFPLGALSVFITSIVRVVFKLTAAQIPMDTSRAISRIFFSLFVGLSECISYYFYLNLQFFITDKKTYIIHNNLLIRSLIV
jgi:hypothetical protein